MMIPDPTPSAAVAPAQNYEPEGVRFFDARSGRELLLVDDASPQYPGWLVYRHPDGQWVTLRKATPDDRARVSAMNVPAAVAPTGGETVRPGPRAYQSAWQFGKDGAAVLLTAEDWLDEEADVYATIASDDDMDDDGPSRAGVLRAIVKEIATLRAERTQWAEEATRLIAESQSRAALSSPVRAERGEAERDAMRLDIPGGLETRIVEYATAIPDGRADDVMIHLTTPDKTYLGTLTLGWFREHTSVGEAERQVLYGETMRAKLAALTPTPPATPTEPTDAD